LPLHLGAIRKKIGGQIEGRCLTTSSLRIDELGKIEFSVRDIRGRDRAIRNMIGRVEKATGSLDIVAMGSIDEEERLSVFVSNLKDVTSVLAREVELTVRAMGLASERTKDIAQVVANEIVCDVAMRHDINYGSLVLTKGRTFSGWFVVNEKLRREMLSLYAKSTGQYSTSLTSNESSLVRRLITKLGGRADEIATGVLVGLVVEACVRIVIYVIDILHYEGGMEDIEELGFPPLIVGKIRAGSVFTSSDIATALNSEEWEVLLMLNTLRQLDVATTLDIAERSWRGTETTKYPLVLGATVMAGEEEAVACEGFHDAISEAFPEKRDLDWKPDRTTGNLVKKLLRKKKAPP